ncbi:hypothetical protein [Psychrobacillus sp. NPDC096623]|uniref:hypothetical protein n=1 Tax=Psychrobacillus sp. NPDC096623 TaxID=3364492 RepID=UPI00382A79F9
MRKKNRKIAITVLLALGIFINFSSTIHAEVNNSSPLGALSNSEPIKDPIIGDH